MGRKELGMSPSCVRDLTLDFFGWFRSLQYNSTTVQNKKSQGSPMSFNTSQLMTWSLKCHHYFGFHFFYFLGGKALRIASGTTKLLNDDLINVLDPDSTKAEISITLVPASGKILLIFFPKILVFCYQNCSD